MGNIYRGYIGFRVSQNWGYLSGGFYTKDYGIWGSILGCPYLGKLPHTFQLGWNVVCDNI